VYNFLDIHRDKLILIVLLIIATVICYYRLLIQIDRGPGYDTYSFLLNGLFFAGKVNYYEVGRPPFLPFLYSLLFRMGYTNELVAYIADCIFFVLGIIGFYLLLRLRFPSKYSFIGSLILISFPQIIMNLGFGISDLPSVFLSIWTIYFLILAVEKDSRFFYLVFPFLAITFMTRFTGAVLVFPVILYFFLRGKLSYLKDIFLGIFISIITVFLPYSIFLWYFVGDPLAYLGPYTVATASPETGAAGVASAPTASSYFYIESLPNFLASTPFKAFLLSLLIIGLISIVLSLKRNVIISKSKSGYKIIKKKINILAKIGLILWSILLLYLPFYSSISFIPASILILISFIFIYPYFFNIKGKRDTSIDILFVVWFLIYLTVHSHMYAKVERYFVVMAPPISYFIILGLSKMELLKKISDKNRVKKVATFFIAIILIFSTLATFSSISTSYQQVVDLGYWGIPDDLKEASEWFNKYEKRENLTIFSDYGVSIGWYTQRNILLMPEYTKEEAFQHHLDKYKADYFIAIHFGKGQFNKTYDHVAQFGTVNIFKRKNNATQDKNRVNVLLIGKDINNYIENVLDYQKYYVISKKNYLHPDYMFDTSYTYIDDYSLEELKKYPIILLYNFRWHDDKKAENLLKEYVKSGGTVIIDASRNSVSFSYNLDDRIFLDTLIIRKSVREYPDIKIINNTYFNESNPIFSKFLTETGQEWQGTTYKSLPFTANKINSMVTVDGNTLVGIQKIGKGKIIWVGYNLFFHAFYYNNTIEKEMVKDIFSLYTKN